MKHTWVEEVRQHQPSAKILLVGTKSDLRGKKKDNDRSEDNSNRREDVRNVSSEGERPNGFPGLSLNARNVFFLPSYCSRIVLAR